MLRDHFIYTHKLPTNHLLLRLKRPQPKPLQNAGSYSKNISRVTIFHPFCKGISHLLRRGITFMEIQSMKLKSSLSFSNRLRQTLQ